MADTPPEYGGEGWWLASDGKWYPPTSLPEPPKPPRTPTVLPAAGSYLTSSGSTFTVQPVKAKRGRWITLALVLVAVGAIVAFLLVRQSSSDDTVADEAQATTARVEDAIVVTFTLSSYGHVDGTVGSCRGTGGYSDFRPGMDVKVTDEEGRTVGAGPMESIDMIFMRSSTLAEDLRDGKVGAAQASSSCTMAAVIDLDGDAKFYDIEVGKRGVQTYSASQLETMGWRADLSLG